MIIRQLLVLFIYIPVHDLPNLILDVYKSCRMLAMFVCLKITSIYDNFNYELLFKLELNSNYKMVKNTKNSIHLKFQFSLRQFTL